MRRPRINAPVKILAVVAVFIALVLIIVLASNHFLSKNKTTETSANPTETEGSDKNSTEKKKSPEEVKAEQKTELLQKADLLAAGYDYDGAIAALQSFEGYAAEADITGKIADYEQIKGTLVSFPVEEVQHVFYHSLIVDPSKAFANHETSKPAQGMNQWMTTVEEFNKITQDMYDKGYVLVSIHDLVTEQKSADGSVSMEKGTIMLPPGKKAFVLSQDDLSYYHSYTGYGIAAKLIVDENGKPVNEYYDASGNLLTGAYDVVPLLDQFIEEHPDAAYHGARGIIALTGYNGILGYRTDESYKTQPADLNADKKQWLKDNPDFDLDKERADAKKVADAMKAEGWEFASHTWGHLHIDKVSLETLKTDSNKWKDNVETIVGDTDVIIFAFGADLGGPGKYNEGDPKVALMESMGFRIFCNVDGNPTAGPYFASHYMRMPRRNLDGYRIYMNSIGKENNLSDLFDAKEVLDKSRPPVKPLT
ncbi:hydrolase [Clostridia bacterium]|nr:hydrolase [Clostridia bacterium]